MDSSRLQHLAFIQNIITRLAITSVVFKVLTVMALCLFNVYLYFLVIPIVATLWIFDAYCLLQQRQYGLLYDRVRLQDDKEQTDFSLYNGADEFTVIKPRRIHINYLMALTEVGFYLPMLVVAVFVSFFGG